MNRIQGVVVGIVRDVNDPNSLGRVQIHFPWLSDDNNSQWARVATLMSGNDRGSWFMPEVGDEVLVAFEHGDTQHPYVLGFLWNGKDKPPNSDITTEVRRLKTVSGHVLEFDDRGGQERVLVKTKAGHQIEMKDTPGSIHIDTAGGQKVDLEDTPAKISLKTTSGNSVEIADAPPGVTVMTSSGTLTINCLMANVTASSVMNMNAPFVNFSGVVKATTVIATTVVGTTYTPGVGNIFGL